MNKSIKTVNVYPAKDAVANDRGLEAHVTAPPAPKDAADPALKESKDALPEIFFRVLARPVVFVLVALGVHLFLRGHNAPGGGFIAGLVIAVASLLLRMAVDRPLLSFAPKALIPWGLLIAFVTGVVPMALGEPFLTSAFGYLHWPFIGEFEWATAVFFDMGVFLIVIGATLTIIDLLADMGEG